MASQEMPRIFSRPASRSVMFLVLQKAMARSYSPWVMRAAMVSSFCSRPSRSMRYWVMSGLDSSTGRTVISTGSRWYTQEMSMTSRLMVAENMPRFLRCLS